MGSLAEVQRRIARIKLTRFIDALEEVFPELILPPTVPVKVKCLLPDHPDRTPSFWLREDRWHCFGCGRGGDLVDFAQAYYDSTTMEAIQLVEAALKLGTGKGADLKALVLLAKMKRDDRSQREWEQIVVEIENEFTDIVRPYMICADTLVLDLVEGPCGYVYMELRYACSDKAARTSRATKQRARNLRRWALGWAWGVVRDVLRVTGKDELDVATQPRSRS